MGATAKKSQRSRVELLESQAKKKITDRQWEIFLRYLCSGYALAAALDSAKIVRANYRALVLLDAEKREQVEIAKDEWIRSAWPDELFAEICSRVSMGELAKDVIPELAPAHLDNPMSSFYRVKSLDPVFKEMWDDARQTAMEKMSDDIIELVDNNTNDVIMGRDKHGNEVEVSNPSAVRRTEVQVKTRQWLMERVYAKQFGTKVQQEVELSVKDPAETLAQARKRQADKAGDYRKRLTGDSVGQLLND